MTREEAIEKIRKMSLPQEMMEMLEALAPELLESEDERIRKWLLGEMKIHYDFESPNLNPMVEKAVDWLERQKEQKEELSTRLNGLMQEYIKSGKDEEEQEHRLKCYKLFWDAIEDSEFFKQKKNPKSAKSISLDCTSDAKCENRWHKVEDSLPDNGRLVLANDCLGNTLLARYDGEGNWEVSVYDNDDYYCRNTITKWCEIPSEKQKEQKPVERSLEDDHVIGFVYDLLNEIEWKDNWAMSKDECLRLLNNYSPQKPAEWSDEDERHLMWLCRIIHSRVVHKELSLAEESKLGKWIDKWINHEPQPVQKWDEFDEDCLKRAIWYVENPAPSVVKDTNLALWLKFLPGRFNLQPKREWSEEDEKMRLEAIKRIDKLEFLGIPCNNVRNVLESIRPSWKPSEEQMEALEKTTRLANFGSDAKRRNALLSLYEQLKKL